MRVTQFTYERKLNLGDYNHKTLNAIAVLEESECPHTAAKALMEVVDGELLGKPAPAPKAAPAVAPVVEEKVVAKIPPKKKEVVAPVVEEKVAPVVEKKEEPAPVAKEEVAPAVEKKEEPAKKVAPTSTIPYDRNNDAHKRAFTDFLFATYGNNAESKKKGGSFSRSYEGKPLLDSKSGTLLEEFKTALATAMA